MKAYIRRDLFTIPLACLFLVGSLQAEDRSPKIDHNIGLNIRMIQIKDAFNYGLVFNGIHLSASYELRFSDRQNQLIYSNSLGFGAAFNKGAGLLWTFIPVDLSYERIIGSGLFSAGAYALVDYNWQQYSELQGGRLFWISSYEVVGEMYNFSSREGSVITVHIHQLHCQPKLSPPTWPRAVLLFIFI